ncbi:cytochrome c4 [Paraburkholderia sp. LEh10]|uniref:c-type cytochrome n=1 Tax=Paraburkholderia sp. LEh10 TaxID=2821353 RepID=UPI001AEB1580|nr:c-type cytochrome [Paraburkholderia sp. LEh10]MBP0588641.1 cytochrome c4 [Paraburkholderia sp. LEh10]
MTGVPVSAAFARRAACAVLRTCALLVCAGGLIWPPTPARADAEAGKAKAQTCVACHGPMGNSTDPQYPVLAGQTTRYIYLQLRDFKEGRRSDPRMSPMAANLSKEDMQDLADYFAAQKPVPVAFKADGEAVEAGRKKSAAELCTTCHLANFSGQNEIPRVAGQHYQYIVKQLQDFRSRTRTNDAGNMGSVARNLTDDDIRNLASYVANLQ